MEKMFLKEDYPSDFDWDYLASLNNLKDIITYATKKLGRPFYGGSGRRTYKVDEKTVLKIAYNQAGLAQNYGESDWSKQFRHGNILAEVFRCDEDNFVWIEMERVKPMKNENEMRKFLGGYSLDDVKSYINHLQHYRKPSLEDEKIYDYFNQNEFVLDLADFINSYDMVVGDILRIDHWGTVKRNGVEQPALFDYGLNNLNIKYYYEPNGFKWGVKKQFRDGKLDSNNP